jgi:hypothetical protein
MCQKEGFKFFFYIRNNKALSWLVYSNKVVAFNVQLG